MKLSAAPPNSAVEPTAPLRAAAHRQGRWADRSMGGGRSVELDVDGV
jgi:hypothetical protein